MRALRNSTPSRASGGAARRVDQQNIDAAEPIAQSGAAARRPFAVERLETGGGQGRQRRSRRQTGRAPKQRTVSQATTFTILCGTTMTFFGRLPASARCTASRARTALSMSAFSASRATVTSARFLPLTCTGSVMVSSTSRRGLDLRPGRLRHEVRMAERRPALLGEMRHQGVESHHQDVGGLPHRPGEVGGCRPHPRPLASASCKRIGELVDVGDVDVEAQLLDVVGDLGQRAMGGLAQREGRCPIGRWPSRSGEAPRSPRPRR